MKTFVIASNTEVDDDNRPLYWENGQGWTNLHQADEFTEEERNSLNLPIDGKWMELKRFDVKFMLVAHETYTVEAPTEDEAKEIAKYHNFQSGEVPWVVENFAYNWQEHSEVCSVIER